MKEQYSIDIRLIFQSVCPDEMLDTLLKGRTYIDKFRIKNGYCEDVEEYYNRLGDSLMPSLTLDERSMRFRALWDRCHKEKGSYFSVLSQYGDNTLCIDDNETRCRIEKVLEWNDLSRELGQDIIVCAWLANRDERLGLSKDDLKCFSWPAILRTNDKRLNEMLKQGLSENHFHLNGSTQSFSLSWICMMNHPDRVKMIDTCKEFQFRMIPHKSYSRNDSLKKWSELLWYAVHIRVLLFSKYVLGINIDAEKDPRTRFMQISYRGGMGYLKSLVSVLRCGYGIRFCREDKKECVLDYAISRGKLLTDVSSPYRAMSGERLFLYECFRSIYEGKMDDYEQEMFHLYLVIKNEFRSELIMLNRQSGFETFFLYQNRKDLIFEGIKEYEEEAYRLSIGASMLDGNVKKLEARIMPRDNKKEFVACIQRHEKSVFHGFNKKVGDDFSDIGDYAYIIHFAKSKEGFDPSEYALKKGYINERFHDLRKKSERQVRALQRMRKEKGNTGNRVVALDACSSEIYCRPEVFATEFRYISDSTGRQRDRLTRCKNSMHITYHVGEDFFDIADGLRAIDEALLFLEMSRDDRIGHGTVLGIDPDNYYTRRECVLIMEKQRLLDDLIWMYFRAVEYNIAISQRFEAQLITLINDLIRELYISNEHDPLINYSLKDYYFAWLLRGDEPEWYSEGDFKFDSIESMNLYLKMAPVYDYYKICRNNEVMKARQNQTARQFYHRYHFDDLVRIKGCRPIRYVVDKEYIKICCELQQHMKRKVYETGITIECNPTSNLLISPMTEYSEHPIWALDHGHLFDDKEDIRMSVTINTDDIGVFATSLENEYAVMFQVACLERKNKYNKLDDIAVYNYLDDVRKNGLRTSFVD